MEGLSYDYDALDERLKLDSSQSSRVKFPVGCPVLVVKNTECIFSGTVSECFISLARGSISEGLLQYEVQCPTWSGHSQTIIASNLQLGFAMNCPVNISPSYFTSARNQHPSVNCDQGPVHGIIKGIELSGETFIVEKIPTFIYMVESESMSSDNEVTTCRHIGVDPEFLSFRSSLGNGESSLVSLAKNPIISSPRQHKNKLNKKNMEVSNPQSSSIFNTASFKSGFERCYELDPKVPCFQGDTELYKNAIVPDYTFLMNFPRTIKWMRGRREDIIKQCVMCGFKENEDQEQKDESFKNSSVFIPNQNKGLCTCCDVKVWVVRSSGLQIKWCKGCKNFRPWAAFGEKGHATKCVRCRDRQREKYASQQKEWTDKGVKRKRLVDGNSDSASEHSG